MKRRNTEVVVAVVMLIMGGAIYLLFRTQRLVLFRVIDTLGMTDIINSWRKEAASVNLQEWCVYVLPNALWAGAYVLTMDAILRSNSRNTRLLVTGFIPLLGVVAELLQAVNIIPGTFDWLDIVAYTLPYIIYILNTTSTKNQKICN